MNPDTEYFLLIEEINRGNAPAIFGEVFQLLDRKTEIRETGDDGYPIGTSEYGITNANVAGVVYGNPRHMHCVYESFEKLGWLFTPYMPPKPAGALDVKRFISILTDKLGNTNSDKGKRLFQSMLDMLRYMDEKTSEKQFYFGTDYFEGVWERLIDRVFGIRNKQDYFPRTRWLLSHGKYKEKYPLEPDSIMIYDGKMYVLDAKYYRYGITGNPNHLPNSSSINKQITYGEYIYNQGRAADGRLFNAFLMPYNAAENVFGIHDAFCNVGMAVGNWKNNTHNYEIIQGILIDTRYLMYHYTGNQKNSVIALAQSIESALAVNNGLLPKMDETT